MRQRIIAIHLPQFHPFKENDEWWGKGFTEWTNVAKARPRYKGHYQPHIPADLGFYDLRLEDSRIAQAELAKKYGIYGFCYYHYWFNGQLLMERPIEEMIKSGKPNFPFMICWANENWTRAWDGGQNQILKKQSYSEEDDRAHIKYLCEHYFKDSRYIRVNGKPVFCIYRSTLIPNIELSIAAMRDEARKFGEELYICRFESSQTEGEEYLKPGFDAAIDFQPHFSDLGSKALTKVKTLCNIITNKFCNREFFSLGVDYELYVNYELKNSVNYKRFPCVTPRWDNSPRRQNKAYFELRNSTPEKYEKWLSSIMDSFVPLNEEENFVFINAWNEWAEGNHLEPDLKYGLKYLEATKRCSDKHL